MPLSVKLSALMLLLTLFLIRESTPTLASVPGLYTDHFTYSGTILAQTSNIFQKTWTTALPGVIQYGLTIYEFQMGPATLLSFISKISDINTTTATINVTTYQTKSGFNMISLYLVVVTEDTSYVELRTGTTNVMNTTLAYVSLTFSKFTFTSNSYFNGFLSYMTSQDVPYGDYY
jgi:hypothetical protein